MNTSLRFFAMLAATLGAAFPTLHAQAKLAQTIDLSTWAGVPVTIVQPPPPQPAPGFSLTSIAFNPSNRTLYVADYATTNVYAIDATTNTVQSAVYTNGLFTNADIGPTQNLPGTAPKVVLVNSVTNRWIYMGQGGGAQFSGTTYVEGVAARSFQSGAAWDPVTDNVYASDGIQFFAVNNLKFLYAAFGPGAAVAVHPVTSRVYVAAGNSVVVYDGIALSKASVKIPTAPLGSVALASQATGIAVNPNTNRVYVTRSNALDILDAGSYQLLASVPLPDQTADCLIAGYNCLMLPRPVAVNTTTNTVFVLNSVGSTISVINGGSNTLTGSIAVPATAVVSQPYLAGTQLSETKPGNTIFDTAAATITTLGGAISMAVNESANILYVASVNGTVGVYQLDPPAAPPAFSIAGAIQTPQGAPATGVTVKATGVAGNATAVTDGAGLFVLAGLPAGAYTITPSSVSFAFAPASQGITLVDRNIAGLAFQANPPIVPATYTLSPWTMIAAGVTTTATVTLNQPAPVGGAILTLTASDPKAAKVPSSVTVPAGQISASFPVQGSGVSAITVVTLTAQYNGGTATASLTVAPGDKVNITSATWSQSTGLLTVTATDTNAQATLTVTGFGTMVNQGTSFKLQVPSASSPSSVNVTSNLGAKVGQGVTVTP